MELTQKQEEWLAWSSRVRFLTITCLLAIVVATHELTSLPLVLRYFVPLVLFWYTLAIVCQILLQRIPGARGHATLQTIGDVLMVTGLVYSTGGHESYFTPLYVLVILMSSVLFSRLGVYATATGSFLLLAGMAELTCFSVLPRTSVAMPSVAALQFYVVTNLLAFLGVAYLENLLAQLVRSNRVELAERNVELNDLKALNENIVVSMRGGLLITDLNGQIVLVNPYGAEFWAAARGVCKEASFERRFQSSGSRTPTRSPGR